MEKKWNTQFTIKGITVLAVAALVFYFGYRYGRGEVDRKQVLIENATLKNEQLSKEKDALEIVINDMRADNQSRINDWESKFNKLKNKQFVPPSECTGEADMYGTEFSEKFHERKQKQMESMINE